MNNNQKNLRFRVESSAVTTLLTYSNVYSSGTSWNNISSNVNVSVVMSGSGMPTTGFMTVKGLSTLGDTLGQTNYYDSSGNGVSRTGDWAYVIITMNTSSIFYYAPDPVVAARKTFVHELGHALKLSHPIQSYSLSGHDYNGGYPYAIMNQGFPNTTANPQTAPSITLHDRSCLTAKWGGLK